MSLKLNCQSISSPKNEVLGFSGSPRISGNSDILLKKILSGVEDSGLVTNSMNLTKIQFQGCVGCEKCRRDKICTGITDGMSTLYEPIIAAKGLVLVCPTHNYNITAWMKAFIDRLYCFYNFDKQRPGPWSSQLGNQGRKAIVGAICEQENEYDMGFTLEAMKRPLEALGYEVVGELTVLEIFHKGKVAKDLVNIDKAHQLGLSLADALKR